MGWWLLVSYAALCGALRLGSDEDKKTNTSSEYSPLEDAMRQLQSASAARSALEGGASLGNAPALVEGGGGYSFGGAGIAMQEQDAAEQEASEATNAEGLA